VGCPPLGPGELNGTREAAYFSGWFGSPNRGGGDVR
jgi:hypothetical protein